MFLRIFSLCPAVASASLTPIAWSDLATDLSDLDPGLFADIEFVPASLFHPIMAGEKMIHLGPILARGSDSSVYPITSIDEGWVIKYSCIPPESQVEIAPLPLWDNIHPNNYMPLLSADLVTREAYFLAYVNLHLPHAANRFVYYSPAVPGSPDFARKSCSSSHKMRYLITERIAQTVGGMGTLSVREAVRYGAGLIEILRDMHTQTDVIHGDIHPGNVAINQAGRMVLIDFGEAKFGHVRNRNIVTKQDKLVCDEWNSVWESQNQISSYRDDVYRAVLIIATLIHGPSLLESIAETCYMYIDVGGDETSYYMQIKKELNFFDIVIDYNGGDGMDNDSDSEIENPTFKLVDTEHFPDNPSTVANVRGLFDELLGLVRYPRGRMDLPDYTGILMTLEHIYEYLRRD